jgi:hypothetical protein
MERVLLLLVGLVFLGVAWGAYGLAVPPGVSPLCPSWFARFFLGER